MEEEEEESPMDRILVLNRNQLVNLPAVTTAVIQANVIQQFSKRCALFIYEGCYVMEFPNKTAAERALDDGLQIGQAPPLDLVTISQHLAST